MRLSVVIPAYNEARAISKTVRDVAAYLADQDYAEEIIVVDDGSQDDTAVHVRALEKNIPDLRLLQAPQNEGKGAAVRRGMLDARGEYVVFLDADNATRIQEVERVWEHLGQPRTIVIGSRALPESDIVVSQPAHRVLFGKAANRLIQTLLLPGIQDTQCGFKCFRTDEARQIFKNLQTQRWGFDLEILARAVHAGYRIIEIPVRWRNGDESRVSFGDALRTLQELLRIRRQRRTWMQK